MVTLDDAGTYQGSQSPGMQCQLCKIPDLTQLVLLGLRKLVSVQTLNQARIVFEDMNLRMHQMRSRDKMA